MMATESLTTRTFTAVVEWDPATRLYIGVVPGFLGAHTQAATLDELRHNLWEVTELCLEEQPQVKATRFVGIRQIEIDA